MLKYLVTYFLFFYSLVCLGQISSQSKKITNKYFPNPEIEINTPAFKKKKGYTNHEEMMEYLTSYSEEFPNICSIDFIGESQKGKPIPQFRLTGKSKNRKIKVWIQGGLHGDEPAGTESIFYLIDQLLNDSIHLLTHLDISIVPMANIDGYESHDRYAANGLDLNRDQTKLMAKESVSLKQAFTDFSPHVALDLHEYRPFRRDFTLLGEYGVTNYYDVMFLYSGNLNVPSKIREFTRSAFVNPAVQVLKHFQYNSHDYFSTQKVHGEVQFKQGSNNSRSSATSFALSNCISSLIEIRGVGIGKTSFKRRVHSAYLVSMSYLTSAYENRYTLFEMLSFNEQVKLRDSVIIESVPKKIIQDIKMIDVYTTDLINISAKTNDALQSSSIHSRPAPTAYIIPKTKKDLVDKLQVLGLHVDELSKDKKLEVDAYYVIELEREDFKYEGVFRQYVKAQTDMIIKDFEMGDYIISLKQKNSALAIEVLEPEAPNSFISFGLIKTELNHELPIYRYYEKNTF